PIRPDVAAMDIPDLCAHVEMSHDAGGHLLARVEVELPCRPTQISVDPDDVLLDSCPVNNHWKYKIRWRLTPLYTQLDEVDVTNAYDRWNIIAGPWIYSASYNDPWYTRSPMIGVRAGAFRTQSVSGGAYVAYRTEDRNIVAGVDGLVEHFPWPNTEV